MSHVDDRNWIAAARMGSSAAYCHLVAAHQAELVAFLRRFSANPAEAEDIAQETFLFAWRSLSRFNPDRSFRAWLFGIGWQKCREHRRSVLRRVRREAVTLENTGTVSVDPVADIDLSEAIGRLIPDERSVVLLCLMAGFSHDEAAEIMQVPGRRVKSLIASARHRLAEVLGEKNDG